MNAIIEQQSLLKWQKGSDFTLNSYVRGKLIAKIFNMTIKWEWAIDKPSTFNIYEPIALNCDNKLILDLGRETFPGDFGLWVSDWKFIWVGPLM